MNQRNAAIYLYGEKEVCEYYITLWNTMKKIYLLSFSEFHKILNEEYDECEKEDDLSRYVQEIGLYLFEKEKKK